MPESRTFHDGRIFTVGAKVRFSTKYSSEGTGTITGFGRNMGTTTIKIEPDENTVYGPLERWPLAAGGFHNRLIDHGVHGGEIEEILSNA